MMYIFLTSRQWYVEPTQLITVLVVSNHGLGGYKHHAIQYSRQLFHCLHIIIAECMCREGKHQHSWCIDVHYVKFFHKYIKWEANT